jgi:hypothetical protein
MLNSLPSLPQHYHSVWYRHEHVCLSLLALTCTPWACITGTVTPEILRELFNAVLANMVPDPISQPPVMEVKPDPTGRGGGCRRLAYVTLHGGHTRRRMGAAAITGVTQSYPTTVPPVSDLVTMLHGLPPQVGSASLSSGQQPLPWQLST